MRNAGKFFFIIGILFSCSTRLISQTFTSSPNNFHQGQNLSVILTGLNTSFQQGSGTLTSINPDNAQQGQSLDVTITGQETYFLQGSETTGVWFSRGSSAINASSYFALSDTLLFANFDIPGDAPLGLWDVNVRTELYIFTLSDGFTITSGTLSGWVWIHASSGFGYSLDENHLLYFLSFGHVWYYNTATSLWSEEGPAGWVYVYWPFLYELDTDTWWFALPPESGLWVYHFSTEHWEVLPRIIP